jgi:hypothetical protein
VLDDHVGSRWISRVVVLLAVIYGVVIYFDPEARR